VEKRIGVRLLFSFSCTLEVFIRIQLSDSYTKKIKRKSTEFPGIASQNADHISPPDLLLLIYSPYPGPFLTLPFIDMAMQGPVVERSRSE